MSNRLRGFAWWVVMLHFWAWLLVSFVTWDMLFVFRTDTWDSMLSRALLVVFWVMVFSIADDLTKFVRD